MNQAFIVLATLSVFSAINAASYEPPALDPPLREPVPDPPELAIEAPDRAIADLETRIRETPEDHDAWRDLGWAYWERDQRDRTRELWETWRRLQPDRADVHALLGRLALADDRLGDAIQSFRRSLEIDPFQDDIPFELARTLRWKGLLTEAIERLQALRVEQPDRQDIKLELARALSSNWNYAQALPLWTRLRTRHPNDRDIQLGEALAALHTGSPHSAILDARRVLEDNPDHPTALAILADEAEFGGRPDEAIPWVKHLMDVTDRPGDRLFLQNRLLALMQRTSTPASLAGDLRKQEHLARRMMAEAPDNLDVRLTLSEIVTRQHRFREAESLLRDVLREFNPRHYRTHAMLFEIALAKARMAVAQDHLEALRRFHPQDPYLHWYQARWHAAANDIESAYRALDRLAAAGERGAVAVLLYHALTASDYGPPLSVSRFREHLRALMHAGYAFVTPETIHHHWERLGESAGRDADGRARRVVAITFDDGLESAMRFATPIGIEYGLRFSQYIISGFLERGEPYLSPWNDLARYAESGVWEFGSHNHEAHDIYPIDSRGAKGRPLAVRRWLPDKQRLETESEYAQRIEKEYRKARALISEKLGQPAHSVAYPYGDIGQEGPSNMPDAIPINLRHAANQHAIGFIQVPFAHAVRGAHPLLYGRHEMNVHWSGDQVAQYLIDHHPIILAERTRLQFAQWHGHAAIARNALEALRVAGYPPEHLGRLNQSLRTGMATAFALPVTAVSATPPPRFAGVSLEMADDNLDSRHWFAIGRGDWAASPDVHLSVAAGTGRLTQRPSRDEVAAGTLDLNEIRGQMRVAYIDPRNWVWSAGIGWRGWSGDTHRHRMEYEAAIQGRPTPETALRAELRSDSPDRARAIVDELSREQASLEAQWQTTADWSVHGAGAWEQWSDNNRLLRFDVYPLYAPYTWKGYFTGVRMTHRQSRHDTSGIWTPYRFWGAYGVAGKRGRFAGGRYDVSLRAGLGRETAFPPDTEPVIDGDETLEAVDPSDDDNAWDAAYGASASWQPASDRHWQLNLRVDWNHNTDYDERRMHVSLLRQF